MKRLVGGILAAGGFLLVICGGDGESSGIGTADSDTRESDTSGGEVGGADAEAYIQAGVEELLGQAEQTGQTADEETATCIVTAHVEVIGAHALAAADVSPQEFADADDLDELDLEQPDDAANRLTDRLADCELAETLSANMVDQLATSAGEELSPQAIACVEDIIDDQAAAEAFAITSIEGSDQGMVPVVAELMARCPDVTTALILADVPGPVTPQDEACVRDVLETRPDLARSAFVDQDAAARDQLEDLIAEDCPTVYG